MEENTTTSGRLIRVAIGSGLVVFAWSGTPSIGTLVLANLLAAGMVLVAATGWCPLGAGFRNRNFTTFREQAG